ncbi:Glutamate racemase [Candidatus Profftia lariciata]|uniref:glutamate racemase n=1 Tax=Candidatus Profftia lariciata TaxID=1987921 RepID=UPI001D00E34E|nr:glutamate racemase [Candidatus Profftia lariciata]UDG81780.1 Glutamate racemase [Candidatus Profftia lariciata]
MIKNKIIQPTILIVDSGVGGLSIYKEIKNLLLHVNYIYVMDNQGFPYGEKSITFITNRILNIIYTVQQYHSISMVIIACNTASTVTLPKLHKYFNVPVVGVVPAIKSAVKITRNGIIGLLATKVTMQQPYTQDLITIFANGYTIKKISSSELVVLAESKLYNKKIDYTILKKILYPWISISHPPDTIVLGCTHFPLIRKELAQVLPTGTVLIDSGNAIARRVSWLLTHQINILNIEYDIVYVTKNNPYIQDFWPILSLMGFSKLLELHLLS